MSPHRIVRASLAATMCLATIVAASASTSAAAASASGAILSLSPAHPDPSVAVGKSYFVHTVVPGSTWTDDISVVNTNDTTIDAWVDAVDGITSVRTGAVYSARTTPVRSAGAWVKPSVSSLTVPPHGQTVVAFTVSVPRGASVGDHLTGIAFESKKGTTSGGAVAITTVLRAVLAVQVQVPGPAIFQLHVYSAGIRAVSTTGTSGLVLDMADIGGLLGKSELQISVDGAAGYHRTVHVQLDTMLPGDRITDEILWPDALAAGDYHLSVTEDAAGRLGTPFVTAVHLTAALQPVPPGQVPTAIRADSGAGMPTWVLVASLAAGAGIAFAVFLLIAWTRRRRCLHCHQSHRHGRLVAVDDLDQMRGCIPCAVIVHNAGAGILCRTCLRSHLGSAVAS